MSPAALAPHSRSILNVYPLGLGYVGYSWRRRTTQTTGGFQMMWMAPGRFSR
jgi:hypothetical protein